MSQLTTEGGREFQAVGAAQLKDLAYGSGRTLRLELSRQCARQLRQFGGERCRANDRDGSEVRRTVVVRVSSE